jgi:hypothetical protein
MFVDTLLYNYDHLVRTRQFNTLIRCVCVCVCVTLVSRNDGSHENIHIYIYMYQDVLVILNIVYEN